MLADTIINRQCEISAEKELFKDLKKRGDPYMTEGDQAGEPSLRFWQLGFEGIKNLIKILFSLIIK